MRYDLTETDQAIGPMPAGPSFADFQASMVMPCVGSDGAGEVMTFSYIFPAVLA